VFDLEPGQICLNFILAGFRYLQQLPFGLTAPRLFKFPNRVRYIPVFQRLSICAFAYCERVRVPLSGWALVPWVASSTSIVIPASFETSTHA